MGTLVPFILGMTLPCRAPFCGGAMVLTRIVDPPRRGRWECPHCQSWMSLTEDGKVYAAAWVAA